MNSACGFGGSGSGKPWSDKLVYCSRSLARFARYGKENQEVSIIVELEEFSESNSAGGSRRGDSAKARHRVGEGKLNLSVSHSYVNSQTHVLCNAVTFAMSTNMRIIL